MAPQPTDARPRPVRLVSVDDSRLVHAIVARYLEGSEFEIAGKALDGDEALIAVRELEPDVVLLDIVMPGASGAEVLSAIMRERPLARVVIASSIGSDPCVQDCLKAGARHVLVKPFTQDDLIWSLRHAMTAA